MRGPLALPLPISNNANINMFLQGLQSLFFVHTNDDDIQTVVEEQEVDACKLVSYVAGSLERLQLTPITDLRSFWINTLE